MPGLGLIIAQRRFPNADIASGDCVQGVPTCEDSILNQDEKDVDCGALPLRMTHVPGRCPTASLLLSAFQPH